jgi:translation elongation factor EF-4
VTPSSSSNSLISADDNFTWSYFNINEGRFKLGIVGNFRNMVEAFLDVFFPAESEFVDPILNLIQDTRSEFHRSLIINYEDVYLQLHHSMSKVKFYFYGLHVLKCVVWF